MFWIRALTAEKKGNVWIPDSLFLLKVHPFTQQQSTIRNLQGPPLPPYLMTWFPHKIPKEKLKSETQV